MIWAWIVLAITSVGGLAWIWLTYRFDRLEALLALAAQHDQAEESPASPSLVMTRPYGT